LSPRKYQSRSLRAVGRCVDTGEIDLALELIRRMRGIRHRTQAGAYILVDADRYVYLLPEEAPTTQAWTRKCPKMIVGLYASAKAVFPDAAQVCEDIAAHLAEVLAKP